MNKTALFLLFIIFFLQSCRTRVKTVEHQRLNVEYSDRMQLTRDSIYVRDSIYIERRADTVYRDRFQIRYRDALRIDTAYVERIDSVSYPVLVEVEKQRSFFEKAELSAYRIVVLLILIYAFCRTIPRLLWRRRV